MRYALLTTAALLGFAAAPAFAPAAHAQNTNAPDAASTPMNPQSRAMPDTSTGTTGMTGIRPMRGQQRAATAPAQRMAQPRVARPARPMRAAPASAQGNMDETSGAPPTSEYRGGAGSPLSQRASHITAADTRGEIAPRLPDPGAAESTPEGYIAAAQRALAAGRTGAAQEALERAETRLLTRSTDPSMANQPDDGAMVRQVADARRALSTNNVAGAREALGMAMASGGRGAADRTPNRAARPRANSNTGGMAPQ